MKIKGGRALALLAVAAVVAIIPPGAGAASRCDSQLVVFSRNSGNLVGSVNWNAVACIPGSVTPELNAVADGPVDFRLINPQSDLITVRYADDLRFKPDYITLTLHGLGFSHYKTNAGRADVSLQADGSSWGYESRELGINPEASGCLTVRATYTKRVSKTRTIKVLDQTVKYQTFDAIC